MDAPGVTVGRDLETFGFNDRESHCEMTFEDVRVPVTSLLGEQGAGFAVAQARLGPGRVHHSMRCIGAAERALDLMCRSRPDPTAWGKPLSEAGRDPGVDRPGQGSTSSRARLLTMKTAWLIDRGPCKGRAGARSRRSRWWRRRWRCAS